MNQKIKVLLLWGGAFYHDQKSHRDLLYKLLGNHFELTVSGYDNVLTEEILDSVDVVADYTSWWQPAKDRYTALLAAVMGGTGFACLHPATGTFMNSQGYHDMVGASFVYHDASKSFRVNVEEKKHFATGEALIKSSPITEGIKDFDVQDELFVVDGDVTQWRVHARAEGHPVVWTKRYGSGRVFNCTLGHDERALSNDAVQTLYVRGIQWAAEQL